MSSSPAVVADPHSVPLAHTTDVHAFNNANQTRLQQFQAGDLKPKAEHARVVDQPFAKLNNGNLIPLVGLGTFKTDGSGTDEAVVAALKAGYRHIDCAAHYNNEPCIGSALAAAFKSGHAVREDIFITSKLWTTDHAAGDVRPALLATLKDLRLSYLDLFLIHWPVTEPMKAGDRIDPPLTETWAAMEQLVDEGLVKNIGVSNCSIKKLQELLDNCRIPPAVNQVEVHPLWRNDRLINFCNERGIHVSAYCPMGTPWTSAKAVIRRALPCSKHPIIQEMARKYNKNPLVLLMRWGIQHGTSVLAKSSNPVHIKGNLEGCLGWELGAEDYQRICSIKFQLRLVDGIRFIRPEGPFRSMKDLWDEDETDRCRDAFTNSMYKFPASPTRTLANGRKMPLLGVGTWRNLQVQETVEAALRKGFRHIDCSSQQGNEAEVGAALKEIFSDWLVNRPDVWVSAKLWSSGEAPSAAAVREGVAQTLKDLQLEYLDLYLLPAHSDASAMQCAWRAMEEMVDAGKVRSIGLADASVEVLSDVMENARIPPVVNSLEVHPGHRNDELLHFGRSQGVHVMASSWPATAYMLHRQDQPALMRHPRVLDVARRLGKKPAQVLIRWALQHGTSVSPKAGTTEHIQGILDVLNWELPKADYRALTRIPEADISSPSAMDRAHSSPHHGVPLLQQLSGIKA